MMTCPVRPFPRGRGWPQRTRPRLVGFVLAVALASQATDLSAQRAPLQHGDWIVVRTVDPPTVEGVGTTSGGSVLMLSCEGRGRPDLTLTPNAIFDGRVEVAIRLDGRPPSAATTWTATHERRQHLTTIRPPPAAVRRLVESLRDARRVVFQVRQRNDTSDRSEDYAFSLSGFGDAVQHLDCLSGGRGGAEDAP